MLMLVAKLEDREQRRQAVGRKEGGSRDDTRWSRQGKGDSRDCRQPSGAQRVLWEQLAVLAQTLTGRQFGLLI